jgi:hypothetical protein
VSLCESGEIENREDDCDGLAVMMGWNLSIGLVNCICSGRGFGGGWVKLANHVA